MGWGAGEGVDSSGVPTLLGCDSLAWPALPRVSSHSLAEAEARLLLEVAPVLPGSGLTSSLRQLRVPVTSSGSGKSISVQALASVRPGSEW